MTETVKDSTLTLTDFLLARIAVDEGAAERAGSFTPWDDTFQNDNYGHLTIQPARVLAECEAKRRIVAEHPDYGGYGESCARCADSDIDLTPWPCPTLRAIAGVYAGHPDYRDEWRA